MRKGLIFLFMFITFASFAGHRSAKDALEIAKKSFITFSDKKDRIITSNNAYQLTHTENLIETDTVPLFYVFNQQQDKGFVIVSAEDKTIDVLAYAKTGAFHTDDIPPALQYWLSVYRKNIISIKSDVKGQEETIRKSVTQNQSFVLPLLGSLKWNQTAPYNDMCPEIDETSKQKAATGCVATGMAQMMRYHQWPRYGWGSKKYTTKTLKLPVDANFSFVKYDWQNMINSYGKANTPDQIKAVSQLMFHCGAAVEMDYDKSSSASTVKMGLAFVENFGYDEDIQLIQRDYYSRQEWLQIIKNELKVSRPIIYSASDIENSGHLFICDGYDENDYLHFNWGWGGLSDGYFYVFDLKPPAGDTGAGNGDGYFYNQMITIGIQKPDRKKNTRYSIYMQQPVTVLASTRERDANFKLTLNKVYNLGLNTFSGKIGLALYQNNQLVSVINALNVGDLESYYGYSELNFEDIAIPASVQNGKYLICPVYQSKNISGWNIIRANKGNEKYIQLTVKDESIQIETVSETKPKLQIPEFLVLGHLYQNKTARFRVKIHNAGIDEYHSNITVKLQSVENDTLNQLIATTRVNLLPDETNEFELNGNVELQPGTYTLQVLYDDANYPENANMLATSVLKTVSVQEEPSGISDLRVEGKIAFSDAGNIYQHAVKLNASIKNLGGYFDDQIIAFVFPEAGGSSLAHFGYQNLKIDSLETVQVEFNGDVYLTPKSYKVAIYQMNKNEWKRILPNESSSLSFKLLKTEDLSLSLPEDYLKLTPNPVISKLNIETNIIPQRIIVYAVDGVEKLNIECRNGFVPLLDICHLNTGYYLIKVNDSAGKVLTKKFFKK